MRWFCVAGVESSSCSHLAQSELMSQQDPVTAVAPRFLNRRLPLLHANLPPFDVSNRLSTSETMVVLVALMFSYLTSPHLNLSHRACVNLYLVRLFNPGYIILSHVSMNTGLAWRVPSHRGESQRPSCSPGGEPSSYGLHEVSSKSS